MKNPTERTLAMLCCLANAGQPLTVRELAALTGQPMSSAYRHLGQLLAWSLVSERETGYYAPGPQALRLKQGFEQHNSLLRWARPLLLELAELTGESVALMLPTRDQALCAEMIDSSQPLRCCYSRGQVQPLLKGASAMALLAWMTDEARETALADQACDEREHLLARLPSIREQGVAVSQGELDPGVWGVSAPVCNARHQLRAAVSLMAPDSRVAGREALLAEQTREIAHRLGGLLE